MKNKQDDEKRKKNLKQMNYDAAEPRAPASSTAKIKRKLKKMKKTESKKEEEKEKENEDIESKEMEDCKDDYISQKGAKEREECQKDYVSPKRTIAMKRQLERYTFPKRKAGRNKKEQTQTLGVDGSCITANNEESDILVKLTNLSKASREKTLPTASTLKHGRQKNKRAKGFQNVGSDIVKVCLSQPMWALTHRSDSKRGFDEWCEKSNNLIELFNNGNAKDINTALETAVSNQIYDAVKERVYFEKLCDVCNDLFKTSLIPNKTFDKNFSTIATDNDIFLVKSLSISKYFEALNKNVWQKIMEPMDILLTGGGIGDRSPISQLEKCAENVIKRAEMCKPVETMLNKAVKQANQAHKLSIGAFIPSSNKTTFQENLHPGGGYYQQPHPPYYFYKPDEGLYPPQQYFNYYHHFYQQQPPPPPPPPPATSEPSTSSSSKHVRIHDKTGRDLHQQATINRYYDRLPMTPGKNLEPQYPSEQDSSLSRIQNETTVPAQNYTSDDDDRLPMTPGKYLEPHSITKCPSEQSLSRIQSETTVPAQNYTSDDDDRLPMTPGKNLEPHPITKSLQSEKEVPPETSDDEESNYTFPPPPKDIFHLLNVSDEYYEDDLI